MNRRKIFKYEIPCKDKFSLDLHLDYRILSIQVQNGKPMIWVMVDETKMKQKYFFSLYATGEEIDRYSDFCYVGTIQLDGFVWHLFDDCYVGQVGE